LKDAIYWALDRGPEGTPDQARLRVYLFAPRGEAGVVTLRAPDGSVAGRAPVMGSGVFTDASCVARVPRERGVLSVVGPVQMDAAAQAAFLADPTAYRAEVDQQGLGVPRPKQFDLPLVDTGCRPSAETTPPATAAQPAPGWQRVAVTAAGISFEVPAGWVQLPDGSWAAPSDPAACQRLTALPVDPTASACGGLLEMHFLAPDPTLTAQYLLPNHFRPTASRREDIPPLGTITRYEGVLEGSAALPGLLAYQMHIVALSDKLALDVSMSARTQDALDAVTPVLDHVVRSVELVP
jgi:hypothetical protein